MQPRYELYRPLLKDTPGVYVEVGTCFGGFAEFLLDNTPVQKLYCVDPYKKFSDADYKDTLNSYTPDVHDKKYRMVWSRLKTKYDSKVDIIRTTSIEASELFIDGSLSVCYIDANHEFEWVKKDILAWLPKIRPGGFICGDDVEHSPIKNGSVRINHAGGAFNVCGVHSALISIKEELPSFDYKIVGSQWYYHVK
jgi:hypothetical protein